MSVGKDEDAVTSEVDPVVRDFLRDKLDAIRETFKPEHLILFGSRARGNAGEGSDIDLIIVSEVFRGVPFPERAPWFFQVVQPEVHIDVLCYTSEEFDKKRKEINIVSEVLPEGIYLT